MVWASNPDSLRVALGILIASYFAEFVQYLRLARIVGIEDNPAVRLVFGAVFDGMDLVAYTTGAALAVVVDTALQAGLRSGRSREGRSGHHG
jgi:hypothetical protein